MKKQILSFWVLFIGVRFATGEPPQITTHVTHSQAALVLEVTSNQSLGQVSFRLPQMQGLRLQYIGQSSQSRYINGVMEHSISWRFYIHGAKEGSYIIPAFQCIDAKNNTYNIPETSFTVTASPQPASQNAPTDARSASAILRIAGNLPRKWYVGQCCPIELQLLVPAQFRGQLSSYPAKEGDAFSASRLVENPQKKTVNIQGAPYTGLAWPSVLTALKSGMSSLKFNVNLEIEQPRQARNLLDDDPLNLFSSLSSMFSNTVPITVASSPYSVEILPLPQPQPENFSQAIGAFNLSNPQVLEHELIQNEPCSFQVKISGSGNFENIQAPELQYDTTQWRSYDPKNHFEPKNDLGFEGTLEFTYTLVPLVEGEIAFPKVVFTYFNPTLEHYSTVSRSALTLAKVKPALRSTATPPVVNPPAINPNPTAIAPSARNVFIGKIVWGKPQNYFWLIQSGLALLTLMGIFWYIKSHNQAYQLKKGNAQKQQAAYRQMLAAFKANQSNAFYTALYQYITLQLDAKGYRLSEILEGHCDALSQEQCALIQHIEKTYQEIHFGQNDVECPQNLSQIKQLIHDLK